MYAGIYSKTMGAPPRAGAGCTQAAKRFTSVGGTASRSGRGRATRRNRIFSQRSPEGGRGHRQGGPHARPNSQYSCHVRVATYNVLSSALSDPAHFTHCKEANLQPDVRFDRVVSKLQTETQRGAVICVQEVSRDWASKLHPFFAQQGYHFIVDTYSEQKSGYMGVGIAIPTARYDLVHCDIRRVADTGPISDSSGGAHYGPSNSEGIPALRLEHSTEVSSSEGAFARVARWLGITARDAPPQPAQAPAVSLKRVSANQKGATKASTRSKAQAQTTSVAMLRQSLNRGSPWELAMRRNNVLVFARLTCVRSGESFCVATYHMPCMYWAPRAMLVQAVGFMIAVWEFEHDC